MIVAFLLAALLLISPASYAGAINISKGETVPDFSLKSIDGKQVSLSEYKGKTTIIVYWKAAQSRSVDALKDVREIAKRYKEKGVQALSLIPGEEDQEVIRKIISDNAIDFPVLIDADRQIYGNFEIRVYPTTLLIGKDGKLAYNTSGHAPTYQLSLEGQLRLLLGEITEENLQSMLNPQREEQDKAAVEAERKYNLALEFIKNRLFDQALDSAKKAVEAKPSVAKAHLLLGFLFLETKEADKALDEFNKTLELDPGSHDAKTGQGGALILKGEVDKAIEVLTVAGTANPYPQMTYYELGKAYEQKGDKDKAVEMYKKSIEKIIKKQILPSMISQCQ